MISAILTELGKLHVIMNFDVSLQVNSTNSANLVNLIRSLELSVPVDYPLPTFREDFKEDLVMWVTI